MAIMNLPFCIYSMTVLLSEQLSFFIENIKTVEGDRYSLFSDLSSESNLGEQKFVIFMFFRSIILFFHCQIVPSIGL